MGVNKRNVTDHCKVNKHFALIPNEIFDITDVSIYGKMIWIYLATQGQKWQSSIRNIASNCARRTKPDTHSGVMADTVPEACRTLIPDPWRTVAGPVLVRRS